MLIYTETITPRLQYIAAFAGDLLVGQAFELTTDRDFFLENAGAKINYSAARLSNDDLWLRPHSLLFENFIRAQDITCSEHNGRNIFFQTEGDWPFDIFAASFYLVSRYEEYLAHEKDAYGRYGHENSLAFREGFLHLPLVNLWWNDLKVEMKKRFTSLEFSRAAFTFIPTYDIDIAWSYRHKGWQRAVGGLIHSVTAGQWQQARKRFKVLRKAVTDPFDSYDWLYKLHEKFRVKPYYFFLIAQKNGIYDRNILPGRPALRKLIREHFNRYPVGVHPSWRSGDEHDLLQKEVQIFSDITGSPCLISRQHYIRFNLPDTFRRLIAAGIRYDFSMGYGSINGFRASVATPYYWYDLMKESVTTLMLFPFCYMEANSYYEQKYSAVQALAEMREYRKSVKAVNGTLITIWHNHFLGSEDSLKGWKEVYEQFMAETAEKI